MVGSNYQWVRIVAQVWSIPVLILVSTLIGLAAGVWLDGKLRTAPWFAIVLTFLGLAAGLYESVKVLIRASSGSRD
ncbi:MAG: AtpZ/AtpI family protein [Armatimonadota bacterium]